MRDLMVHLRDTFRDAASRIDQFLASGGGGAPVNEPWRERRPAPGNFERDDRFRGPAPSRGGDYGGGGGRSDPGIRNPLEGLRDEARRISQEAPQMDPAELRLRVEAVTAETRALQNRAQDEEDRDIAAKILRALTAIVSEHRPGHVYGLARHHQADWDEVGRRARADLSSGGRPTEHDSGVPEAPHGDHDEDGDIEAPDGEDEPS